MRGLLVLLIGLTPVQAWATQWVFDITNNSSFTWSDGVVAVMADSWPQSSLLDVGPTPVPGDYDAAVYGFGHDTCDGGATA